MPVQLKNPAQFVLEDYYDVLLSASVKEPLKPFVAQFKANNIPFIHDALVSTLQILTGRHEKPLMKFNALMAIKLFFDTGEYVPVNLIQVYALPIILEVAAYRALKRSEQGLTLYFVEKGYESTKQMKRLGFNFVLLAIQFAFMAGRVKTSRTIQNQQLDQPSNFVAGAKLIREKGVPMVSNFKFYIPSYLPNARKRYLRRLKRFNPQDYTDFFLKQACDELSLGRKPELDMKKLLLFGDAYLTIPLMHICEQELGSIEGNLPSKRRYMNLLGDFLKTGDIYALLIITRCSFIESIANQVQKVNGEMGVQAGQGVYPDAQASKTDRRQFYIQYLKNLQIWGYCHPADQDGSPTQAKRIYDFFKNERRFEFPTNILLPKMKAEMEANLKINQQRNEKLIRLADQQSEKASLAQSNQNSKMQSYIEFNDVKVRVAQAQQHLDSINQKQGLNSKIQELVSFRNYWQNNIGKTDIDADEDEDIEPLVEEGQLCLRILEIVQPVYTMYNKDAISFDEYKEKVDLLIKKEAEASNPKETSFEARMGMQSSEVEEFVPSEASLNVQSQTAKDSLMGTNRFNKYKQPSEAASSQVPKSRRQTPDAPVDTHGMSGSQFSGKPKTISRRPSRQSEPEAQEYGLSTNRVGKKTSKVNHSNVKTFQQALTHTLRSGKSSKMSFKDSYVSSSQQIDSKSNSHQGSHYNSEVNPSDEYYQQGQSTPHHWGHGRTSNLNQSRQSISSRGSMSSRSSRRSRVLLMKKKHNQTGEPSAMSKGSAQYQHVFRNAAATQPVDKAKDSFISSESKIESPKVIEVQVHSRKKVPLNSIKLNTFDDSRNEEYYGKVNEPSSNRYEVGSNSRVSFTSDHPSFQMTPSMSRDKISVGSKAPPSVKKTIPHSAAALPLVSMPNIPLPSPRLLQSRYQQEQSEIQPPEVDPLLQSYHLDLPQEHSTLPSNVSSFKECFEVENQIINASEKKQKLLGYKEGKMVNFIGTPVPKQTPRNSSIIDMLSERTAKNSIENYRNQMQQFRASEAASEKARSVESLNKNMRMKVLVKSRERVKQLPPFQLPSNKVGRGSEVAKRDGGKVNTEGQAGPRLINNAIYLHYFPQQKVEKTKKCMLKSKGLILKDDEFEIGTVTTRRQKCLEVTLFITPRGGDVEQVEYKILSDNNLKIQLSHSTCKKIFKGEQEHVTLQCEVDSVPYVLPTLTIKYLIDKYTPKQLVLPLPCSFNKFFKIHGVQHARPIHSQDEAISTGFFRPSHRLTNPQKIQDSLFPLQLLHSSADDILYGAETYFRGKIFVLHCHMTQNKMQFEGRNMTGDHKNTKYLQFLLVTLREVFETLRVKQKPQ